MERTNFNSQCNSNGVNSSNINKNTNIYSFQFGSKINLSSVQFENYFILL